MPRDVVFIKGLEVETVIGVFEWERAIRQKLVFTIEMSTDISRAALSDSLADAPVDYNAVSQRVRSFVEASNFQLLEALAGALCSKLIDEFSTAWIRLTVEKPRPESGYTAGLVIERP